MKHGNKGYVQVNRKIYEQNTWEDLSDGAKLLYFWLKELEHRYCKDGEIGMFYRSNEQLAEEMGWSLKRLKKYKAVLKKKTDLVIIGTTKTKYVDKNGVTKKSAAGITYYALK